MGYKLFTLEEIKKSFEAYSVYIGYAFPDGVPYERVATVFGKKAAKAALPRAMARVLPSETPDAADAFGIFFDRPAFLFAGSLANVFAERHAADRIREMRERHEYARLKEFKSFTVDELIKSFEVNAAYFGFGDGVSYARVAAIFGEEAANAALPRALARILPSETPDAADEFVVFYDRQAFMFTGELTNILTERRAAARIRELKEKASPAENATDASETDPRKRGI